MMQTWCSFERAWGERLLSAMIPRTRTTPGWPALDAEPFWSEFNASAPFLLRTGFRAAVWLLAGILIVRCRRPLRSIAAARVDDVLTELSNSPLYVVRQLVMTLKLVACLGYFREPAIRETITGVAL